jgi:parallel beta-helix repeat protein
LTANIASKNNGSGFLLFNLSSGNVLISNIAIGNDSPGFYLMNSSSTNTLIANVANKNNSTGFYLDPSSSNNNALRENICLDNGSKPNTYQSFFNSTRSHLAWKTSNPKTGNVTCSVG